MNRTSKLAFALTAVIGTSTFAGTVTGRVGSISVGASGGFIVQILDGSGVAQTLCNDTNVAFNGRQFGDAFPTVLPQSWNTITDAGIRAWLSTLTAAKLAGKEVTLVTQTPPAARDRCLIQQITIP